MRSLLRLVGAAVLGGALLLPAAATALAGTADGSAAEQPAAGDAHEPGEPCGTPVEPGQYQQVDGELQCVRFEPGDECLVEGQPGTYQLTEGGLVCSVSGAEQPPAQQQPPAPQQHSPGQQQPPTQQVTTRPQGGVETGDAPTDPGMNSGWWYVGGGLAALAIGAALGVPRLLQR